MQIILNADDFGGSPDTVAATIACFEHGDLTSATIMPNMPATDSAIEFALAHPELSFGVHITVTGDGAERALTPAAKIPGLVDREGRFLATRTMRMRAVSGRLSVDELEREIHAQVEHVSSCGVAVSHVDSHRHLHKLGPVRAALRRVLPRLHIPRVRSAQDVWLRRPLLRATYWWSPRWRRLLAEAFVTTDHFFMPSGAGDAEWPEALLEHIRRLPGRTLEVGVHPGTQDEWRVPEERSLAAFVRLAREDGHELVSWGAVGP